MDVSPAHSKGLTHRKCPANTCKMWMLSEYNLSRTLIQMEHQVKVLVSDEQEGSFWCPFEYAHNFMKLYSLQKTFTEFS